MLECTSSIGRGGFPSSPGLRAAHTRCLQHVSKEGLVEMELRLPFSSREVAPVTILTPGCRVVGDPPCSTGVHTAREPRSRAAKICIIRKIGIVGEDPLRNWRFQLKIVQWKHTDIHTLEFAFSMFGVN